MSNTAIATLRPATAPLHPGRRPQGPPLGARLKAFLQSMLAELLCWTAGVRPE